MTRDWPSRAAKTLRAPLQGTGRSWLRLCLVAVLVVCPQGARAHNGKVALALPVSGIQVDGDLSDWPADLPVYPVALTFSGDRPRDHQDLAATFQVAYDSTEVAIYVAMRVVDEMTVLDTTAQASWNTQDGYGITLDVHHSDLLAGDEVYSPATHYSRTGTKLLVYNGWGGRGRLEHARVEVRRQGNTALLEWRFDVAAIRGDGLVLRPGVSLGFDVTVQDKDADSFGETVWGRGISKFYYVRSRGDILLTGPDPDIGTLRGRLRWERSAEGVARTRVGIVGPDSSWHCHVATDRDGRFAADLPSGHYRVRPADLRLSTATGERTVDLERGGTAVPEWTIPPPTGVQRPVGPGHRVAVRWGRRSGSWLHFGAADGVPPSLAITDILEDRDGRLWFATREGGVFTYDGRVFHQYTVDDGLISNDVWRLAEDADGGIWMGMGLYGGGGVMRLAGGLLTLFSTDDGLVGSSSVTGLHVDAVGNVWMGTWRGGVSRYDGQGFTSFTADDGLITSNEWSFLDDGEGGLWIGSEYGGLHRTDGSRVWSLQAQDGLASNRVRALAAGDSGSVWVATPSGLSRVGGRRVLPVPARLGGLEVRTLGRGPEADTWFATPAGLFRVRDGQPVSATRHDPAGLGPVTAMHLSADGQMWLGGEGGKVSRFDAQQLVTVTPAGVGGADVRSILEDRTGTLWFGTLASGVLRYDGRGFRQYTVDDGLASNTVGVLFEDSRGRIWMGTGAWESAAGRFVRGTGEWLTRGGVTVFAEGTFSSYHADDGLTNEEVWCIVEDASARIWFGTRRGVTAFEDGVFRGLTSADAPGLRDVWCILQDRSGAMWLGTWASGAYRFDDGQFESFGVGSGLPHNDVRALHEDRNGDLWLGTLGGGLARYDGSSFRTYGVDDGLAHRTVETIYEARDGALWFGTGGTSGLYGSVGGGVSRLQDDTIASIGVVEGLQHTAVSSIVETRDGKLLLGTLGGGISIYADGMVQNLLDLDGLADNVVWDVHEDRKGDVWIATAGGVSRYRPSRTPPAVAIASVVADRDYGSVEELDIDETRDYLAFRFTGASPKTRPEAMLFRYRLRGHDEGWQVTRERQVVYQDLPRGDYVFEVVAVDRDLDTSEAPAGVRLRVHRSYARMAWLAALALAVVGIAWQTRRLMRRDQRLRETNAALLSANQRVRNETEAKTRFLRNMSHELRTPINAISGFTALMRTNREGNLTDRQLRNLATVERNAGGLLGLVDQLLDLSRIERGQVEIRPESVDVSALVADCLASTEPLVAGRDVELRADVPTGLRAHTDRDRLRQVLMNLLGNAAKFTEAGSITVTANGEEERLRLSVRDTGPGIPAAQLAIIFEEFARLDEARSREGTGLGLAITRQLCHLLGGTVRATSVVGEGSTFTVEVPLAWRGRG